MSAIRSAEPQDFSEIAALFQRILRRERRADIPATAAYLRELFLDPPADEPGIRSLVHLRDDGTLSGFLGILPLPMRFAGKSLRGAVSSSMMVENNASDPYAGARLMRQFLAGPQDVSLTETANAAALNIWRNMRGQALPGYSLEWLRVIRPATFLTALATGRFSAARLALGLSIPMDLIVKRLPETSCWVSRRPETLKGHVTVEIDDDETAELLVRLGGHFSVHPDWEKIDLERMVSESRRKTNYGGMVRRKVEMRNGQPAGLFVYHGDSHGIGRVLQVLAAPGKIAAVLDCMIADAADRGLAALRGRTRPDLIDAMLGRNFIFSHAAASTIHTGDEKLRDAFLAGQAFFNGYGGESWCRLLGDEFLSADRTGGGRACAA